MWAFMSAYAATLAIIQVRNKEPFHLMNAAFRAVDLAKAALDAFFLIEYGHESPPGTGFCDTGAARIYQSASLNFHQETLS
jgi:hypothetical protein